jgi:hypothetical protein
MQINLNKAIAAVLAVGAAVASTGADAQIAVLPNVSGGSDLVLFVSDTTNGDYFAQDLGVSLNSTGVTSASVAAGGVFTTAGSFSTPTSFAGLDTKLAAFLTSDAAGVSAGDVSYSIMAADDTSSQQTPGTERALITSTQDYSVVTPSTTFTNGNIKTFVADTKTFFQDINNNYSGSNTSSSYGWGTGTGAASAPNSFISASLTNGALIGTAQTMYVFGTNGSGLGFASNPYVGGTVNISAAGVITVTNSGGGTPVPVPAAVWLLGSGLLGLIGVGRRRAAGAVAAV